MNCQSKKKIDYQIDADEMQSKITALFYVSLYNSKNFARKDKTGKSDTIAVANVGMKIFHVQCV